MRSEEMPPVTSFSAKVDKLRVSQTRELTDIPIRFYFSLRQGGFASLIYWLEFEEEEHFSADELCELASMIAGSSTSEIPEESTLHMAVVDADGGTFALSNFVEIAQNVHRHLAKSLGFSEPDNTEKHLRLVHPARIHRQS